MIQSKQETIQEFHDHVSSGKADFFKHYGMDCYPLSCLGFGTEVNTRIWRMAISLRRLRRSPCGSFM